MTEHSIVFTDDKLARKYCEKLRIEVHGTVYLLAKAYCENLLSFRKAKEILAQINEKGFWLRKTITIEKAIKKYQRKKS
ncbi:MAG: DUF3368 domain-containing protein [Kosmotogaceae bacterium]